MNEMLSLLETMLKQMSNVDVPFKLQSKYQPKLDSIINELHKDIDDITDKLVEMQENIDNN